MGAIVISIDAELGWGYTDFESPPADRVEGARDGWTRLLSLFDTHDLPATWAVVGHLLLEDCDGTHADHPAGPDWFERERTDWGDRPDLRFGRDLVRAIDDAGQDHEIGSHTFSHVVIDEDRNRTVARAEFERSRDLIADFGTTPTSFVYPRNVVGHRDVLAETGFDCYRGAMATIDKRGPVRKIADSTVLASEPRIVHATVDEYGLVNVPPSLYLFGFEGLPRRITATVFEDPIVKYARRGIRAVAEGDEEGIFHMWLHPNNVTTESDAERIDSILACVADHRNDLDVLTMGEVAARARTESERVTVG